MQDLPEDVGIEIFSEWGSRDYWDNTLPCLMTGRTGGFSIHGPAMFDDFSLPCDEHTLFEHMKAPFDLYHRFGGEFYVVHTNAGIKYAADPTLEEENRKRAVDRIAKFQDICTQEGVRMVVENIGWNAEKRYLFNQEQFLDLFRQLPEVCCLIDIGHTLLSDINVAALQKALKNRIVAYHIHDNDGVKDLHLPICEGVFNWRSFMKDFHKYTPDATLVMEYEGVPQLKRYLEDINSLKSFV